MRAIKKKSSVELHNNWSPPFDTIGHSVSKIQRMQRMHLYAELNIGTLWLKDEYRHNDHMLGLI